MLIVKLPHAAVTAVTAADQQDQISLICEIHVVLQFLHISHNLVLTDAERTSLEIRYLLRSHTIYINSIIRILSSAGVMPA